MMKSRNSASISALDHFQKALTPSEKKVLKQVTTPYRIQLLLDSIAYSTETVYRSPLRVLREQTCQCFDGAVFAAALFRRIRYPALILNLLPNSRDDDHVLTLFRRDRHWGAVAKSNFAGLRFREPVYRSVRELVMSYFELYYNTEKEKTLRGYTRPLDLRIFDRLGWMIDDNVMELISDRLDQVRRFSLLTKPMVAGLSPVDERSFRAGLYGANMAGISAPDRT